MPGISLLASTRGCSFTCSPASCHLVISAKRRQLSFSALKTALFSQDCDESVHMAIALAMNHQRYLATGIKVALGSKCVKEAEIQYREPPNLNGPQVAVKQHAMKPPSVKQPLQLPSTLPSPPWAVDDLLAFSEIAPPEKKGGLEPGEQDWWSQMNLFGEPTSREALAAEVPEVPEVPTSQLNSYAHQRPNKAISVNKKPRIRPVKMTRSISLFPISVEAGNYSCCTSRYRKCVVKCRQGVRNGYKNNFLLCRRFS